MFRGLLRAKNSLKIIAAIVSCYAASPLCVSAQETALLTIHTMMAPTAECTAKTTAVPVIHNSTAKQGPTASQPKASGNLHSLLAMFESKYFGHVFTSDSDSERLNRLEKLIYGNASDGKPCERLDKLSATILSAHSIVPLQDPVFSAETIAQASELAKAQITSAPGMVAQRKAPIQTPSSYPRVTALEQLILGKVYLADDVNDRISRLEEKEKFKPLSEDALVQRLERIEKKEHAENMFLLMNNSEMMSLDGLSKYLGHPVASPESYPLLRAGNPTFSDWISSMEEHVFGRAEKDDSLLERLARLETRLYSAPTIDARVMNRVNRIWATIEPAPKVVLIEIASQPVKPQTQIDAQIAAFEMPINAELSRPADPIVDGFQMPVNQSLDKSTGQMLAAEDTASTVKSSKHGMFHRIGKVLQVANSAMDAVVGTPTPLVDYSDY